MDTYDSDEYEVVDEDEEEEDLEGKLRVKSISVNKFFMETLFRYES